MEVIVRLDNIIIEMVDGPNIRLVPQHVSRVWEGRIDVVMEGLAEELTKAAKTALSEARDEKLESARTDNRYAQRCGEHLNSLIAE